ncbi:DUF1667 domain-containing protein [Desulfosporosinus sp.]|uniref:DUF1667 domain-containing protein n=1 Tax=Desulfosporosinus sp. TaxID=157907 RepID=UPI0025BD3095|nr:DUF1667 domain-containing protein [Desulfosporosinus sp.]MBC2724354.1 DUF1667 domain-containing protein [Desulfosporosinus sp.]MBC2726068.1 DUF1667 domain-containing protein [Desulfosporosinus sp.]
MTELICILCPKGCHLRVNEEREDGVTGNNCLRGEEYGQAEVTNPTRVVTSTVYIKGGEHQRCPVKSDRAIPKNQIFAAMRLLEGVRITSPVKRGEIVIENILGTGINFVATREM